MPSTAQSISPALSGREHPALPHTILLPASLPAFTGGLGTRSSLRLDSPFFFSAWKIPPHPSGSAQKSSSLGGSLPVFFHVPRACFPHLCDYNIGVCMSFKVKGPILLASGLQAIEVDKHPHHRAPCTRMYCSLLPFIMWPLTCKWSLRQVEFKAQSHLCLKCLSVELAFFLFLSSSSPAFSKDL